MSFRDRRQPDGRYSPRDTPSLASLCRFAITGHPFSPDIELDAHLIATIGLPDY
ncbi:hypothetical protein [Nitrobacter winogradskyi]|uniref:hypothetical protein n=1 Tax=Nitrobacter winogradskyi TaxID=913 RepID=UPI0002D8BFBA|nr:hypothetical protein [Nitrobacter winogradskyi]